MDGHHKVSHIRHRFQPMLERYLKLREAACKRVNYKSLNSMEDAQALLASADIEIETIDANLHNADRELHELDQELVAARESLRRAHNPNGKG